MLHFRVIYEIAVLVAVVTAVGELKDTCEHISSRQSCSSARSGAIMLQAKSEASEQVRDQKAEKDVSVGKEHRQRHVYLDLGANWANTLRLYQDIGNAPKSKGPWEVYAFEASPLIQPYLESFVSWLNGDGPRPKLLVPPAGSTVHLRRYAARYGCNVKGGDGPMRECMFRTFHKPLQKLQRKRDVASQAFIDSQLALAYTPLQSNSHDRYVVIPAAVGGENGTLTLSDVTAEQMIRGGAHSTGKSSKASTVQVPQVNFASWLSLHFHPDDHIVVKMDIEGAEFPILRTLMKNGGINLIDVLAMECHAVAGNCKELMGDLRKQHHLKVITEGSGYQGWDSLSSPADYLPEDPSGA